MLGNPAMLKLRDNLTRPSRHIPLHFRITSFRDPALRLSSLAFYSVAFDFPAYPVCSQRTVHNDALVLKRLCSKLINPLHRDPTFPTGPRSVSYFQQSFFPF